MRRRVDQRIPYKGLEVHFLVEQVVVLDEIIESSAAAQGGQILWVCIGYDAVQDLVR